MEITLSEWDAENGNNPDLNDYPYVSDGNTIVMQDRYGFAQGYPLHGPWTQTPIYMEETWNANTSGLNTCGQRFMVAKASAVGKEGSSVRMTWYEASGMKHSTYNSNGYLACAQYSEEPDQSDKGMWRLPTIRELQLISNMRLQKKLTAVDLFAENYWSATYNTDYNADGAWSMAFDFHLPGRSYRYNRYYVRCVRDL